MRTIKEPEITALAPNANAAANARKISSGGGFVSRKRSRDDTFYMGECKGSGKSNYVVSADYIDEEHPVFRCTCPSRQLPCKHTLALLYEMAAGKDFELTEIPEEILDKRARKEAREAQKQSGEKKPASEKSLKAAAAARAKKTRKQLEGLELLRKLTGDLVHNGLASMGNVSLKTYRDLAKQLGDYYLPGPLVYLNRLILEMEACQKDQDPRHYEQAVEILKKLRALEKKAETYLKEKLEDDTPKADDELFEELGGIWRLDDLRELGLKKEQARLLQLAFAVTFDPAGKEYIDKGYWVDIDTGELSHTCNYRPVKALSHVKQEDSCFDMARIGRLYYYPGGINRRVRWDAASLEPVTSEVLASVREHAHKEIGAAVKLAKNEMKNLLSEDTCGMLLAFSRIGIIETEQGKCWVLEDAAGGRIELAGRTGQEDSMAALSRIPDPEVFEEQVLFGLMYYDRERRRIRMYPCSIVTDRGIVRLLY